MKKSHIKSVFRSSLFWDADEIDADRHAAYVIARVLDYGDVEEIRVLRTLHTDEKIKEVIRTRRGLFPKTGKYWAVKTAKPEQPLCCPVAMPKSISTGELKHMLTFRRSVRMPALQRRGYAPIPQSVAQ